MNVYEMRCANVAAFCPQASAKGHAVHVVAPTRDHARALAPACRTCEVKMGVAARLDDPTPAARRAG